MGSPASWLQLFPRVSEGKRQYRGRLLSRLDKRLPKEEVQDYLDKIPYPGVKAVLDNAITPLEERAELGVRPNPESGNANQEEAVAARAARLASTNIIDWKVEQKDDPVLYQVVKHLRASGEVFKEALLTVLDKKAVTAYVKAKGQLLLKNGLLYRKTQIGPAKETIFQFVVPQRHRSAAMDGCHQEAAHQGQRRSISLMQERFWWPGMARDLPQPHQEMWPLPQIRSSSSNWAYAAFNLQWARGATAC